MGADQRRCGTVGSVGYPDERLGLLPRLHKLAGGQALSAALRLDGQALRFHLGTSLADLRIPLAVDVQLEDALGAAVRDLLFLLVLRHRAALRADEYDRFLLLDGFDPQRHRPASFGPPSTVARQGVAVAFNEGPELHPALDSGTLAGWIGQGRPGRTLVGLLHSLLRRAVEEERETEGREPTPYLALLALRTRLPERVQTELKAIPLAAPAGRVLQGAVAAGLLIALRLAARESGALDSPSGARSAAALTPLLWLAGGRLFAGSALQAYGVALNDSLPRIDELAIRLERARGPDDAVAAAEAFIDEVPAAQALAARAVAHASVRRELLMLLRLVEAGRGASLQLDGLSPAQLYGQPLALERTLATPERRKELAARLKVVARAVARSADRARIEELGKVVADYREEDPARCLPRGEPARTFSRALAALALDTLFERLCGKAQAALLLRTGEEREGGIHEEHERGRLYLLSADGPILLAKARPPSMGHLFCDVKDFTRRTAFLKEAVVADFLSREFYGPILTAAARHYRGAGHLGDRGGITLNNLLGDAITFSGDVVSLLELAQDIRKAIGSYARRLDAEASSAVVARVSSQIEERFAGRRAELASESQAALEAAAANPARADLRHRAEELERNRARLDEDLESELSLASGEKLEAGIFISYGAAPEVATFDDAVFGPIRVSIAEKINESARGTARNGAVRARIDALVAGARASRGRPDVTCPFAVAIGQPLVLPVTAAEESDVRACLARGERNVAEGILQECVRRSLDELGARLGPSGEARGGDIYNGGAALSEEALEAYVAARGKEMLFVRRTLPLGELHRELQQRFVFPQANLPLIAAVAHTTGGLQELFVHVGRALFKGFEKAGGLGVWELIAPESELFSLLALHHVPAWLREEEEAGDGVRPRAMSAP